MTYKVFVDDNFNYQDESERYLKGEFETLEEAIAVAKKIVDDFLERGKDDFDNADALHESYRGFGEDPYIMPGDGGVPFSAWTYARERCRELYAENVTESVSTICERDYFPFRDDEYWIIDETKRTLSRIIAHEAEDPTKLQLMALVMFAAKQLPFAVPGLSLELSVIYRFNNESSWCDLEIGETRLAFSEGGNTYAPGIGSDSRSETLFEMETSGFRDACRGVLPPASWFQSVIELLEIGAVVEVHDNGESESVDLEDNIDDPWETYLMILESFD